MPVALEPFVEVDRIAIANAYRWAKTSRRRQRRSTSCDEHPLSIIVSIVIKRELATALGLLWVRLGVPQRPAFAVSLYSAVTLAARMMVMRGGASTPAADGGLTALLGDDSIGEPWRQTALAAPWRRTALAAPWGRTALAAPR
eukprot:CAMPEP_0174715890 /NCGR_PEP_ID=MMETSP1094-20130205/22672_1 /TAXON_ID=156173 /ORGANISM="Chrysochromulina brevifilum, Strain UTEX LB 985" /LENGTH=142 /DNA_ID=CAMNT_0015915557 /DNA_START=891 /DNA_END=1317 /DNA_ORIENTATION=+